MDIIRSKEGMYLGVIIMFVFIFVASRGKIRTAFGDVFWSDHNVYSYNCRNSWTNTENSRSKGGMFLGVIIMFVSI